MADAEREGLKAAADVFSRYLKRFAGKWTRRGAEAVNVSFEGSTAVIAAGHDGGPWGWDPIQASMFDNDRRHPLFGDKKHWYHQGLGPMTELTEKAGIAAAAQAWNDTGVTMLLKEHGWDE